MKQFVVIAYDVTDNRRRQKIAKTLERYGLRCNESVFECILTETRVKKLKQTLEKLAYEPEDVILFYYLCRPCVMKRESIGQRSVHLPPTVIV